MEKAAEFLQALVSAGFERDVENISPDYLDQLFLNRSTAFVMDAVIDWLQKECPSTEQRRLHERLVKMGLGTLPEPECIDDLEEEIKETERLINVYEENLVKLKEDIDGLQCQAEIKVVKPKHNRVENMQLLRQAVIELKSTVIPDESCSEFSCTEVWNQIHKIIDSFSTSIQTLHEYLHVQIRIDKRNN